MEKDYLFIAFLSLNINKNPRYFRFIKDLVKNAQAQYAQVVPKTTIFMLCFFEFF
jgi:hypothetical protein